MHLLNLVATQDQKRRFLSLWARGHVRSCFGMTEPTQAQGRTRSPAHGRARRDGNWIINGHKRFISGAVGARFCIVLAPTEAEDTGAAGATMFLVDMSNRGTRIGAPIDTWTDI